MTALQIRKDRTAVVLRKASKATQDARVSRRILAIANALSGMSRKAAAQAAGMDRQTLCDWVARYNEHGLDGLADRWGEGRPPTLSAQEQAELVAIVMAGSDPEATGLSRQRVWFFEFGGFCEVASCERAAGSFGDLIEAGLS